MSSHTNPPKDRLDQEFSGESNKQSAKRTSELFSELALGVIDIGVILLDENRHITLWNQWLEKASGLKDQEVIGRKIDDVFVDVGNRLLRAVDDAISKRLSSKLSSTLNRYALPLFHYDGKGEKISQISQSIVIKPISDKEKRRFCLIYIDNVTDVMKRESLLKKQGGDLKILAHQKEMSELRTRSILNNTLDSIIMFDKKGLIISLNPATKHLFKIPNADDLPIYIQSLISEFQQYKNKSIEEGVGEFIYNGIDQKDARPQCLGVMSSGRTIPVELAVSSIAVGDDQLYTAVIRDLSERKTAEDRLTRLAQYDHLTRVANRSLFHLRLDDAIARVRRNKNCSALALIDLDHFKSINDTLGHDVGDEILKHLSVTLLDCVRDVDLVARLGGDEFAILLEDAGDNEEIERIIHRVLYRLSKPVAVGGNEINISCSIGIASFDQSVETPDRLIKSADLALYHAKENGRNNFQFYTRELHELTEVKISIESFLRNALKNGEFSLNFQPQFDMKTKKIVGAETLLRWEHPEKGSVSPDIFIPILEDMGLISEVGEWVLRQACKQCRSWQLSNLVDADFTIAVNFSARQINSVNIVDLIKLVLLEEDLESHCLDIELTESSLMETGRHPTIVLQELKDLGVCISLDDFGTGYSSLSYLKKFPIDQIKIDRSFVTDILGSDDSSAIVNIIIALAKNLNLSVIAEGVESQSQFDYLRNLDCQFVQGFLLAKPMIKSDFESYIQRYK